MDGTAYTLVVYRYTDDRRPSSGAVARTDSAGSRPSGSAASAAPDDAFVRDRATALGYAALGCFTFWLYAFGPSLALLRQELGFSYTLLGFYSALWALGSCVAGFTFARAARHLSRSVLLWGSAAVTALGAALFTIGSGLPATLVGTAVMGIAGTTLLMVVQAVLSDRHQERRDKALTEANVGAGASAVVAPLVLGALAASALGWRVAFALPAVVLAAMWVFLRRSPMPASRGRPADGAHGRLPLACWVFAGLTALATAIEFCIVYFGAEVLIGTGLTPAVAATTLSSNYLGILVGRVGGAAVTRRPGRTVVLLHGSLALTAAGFGLFWVSDEPVLAVIGLFACGVGVANVYPLALALTLGAAQGHEDQANARTQLLVGALSAGSPYLIGTLADHHGLGPALAVEPVLIIAAFLLLLAGVRTQRTTADPAAVR